MAAGLAAVAAAVLAVAVAAALPVLAAAGASSYADCFQSCFKNCVAQDKSMADYCNFACGMTCGPNGGAPRPLNCQLACVRESCRRLPADGKDMEACYGQCYDGCKITKAGLPRPIRAGAIRPAALHDDHPFHKMQGAVQPTSDPDPDDIDIRHRSSSPFVLP